MGIVSEFQAFISKGSVVDLAVGFVIGAAFTAVVTSFVSGIITPGIGVFYHANFSNLTYTVNNSTFKYGTFIDAIISFIIVAAVIFFLVVKPIGKMEEARKKGQAPPDPTTKQCPECLSTIPIKATRCAFCGQKQKA
jgi:large conductance mechanosensitive channel